MDVSSATALAHPNIALIKYWGNSDDEWTIPANGSISLTLGGLFTRVQVTVDKALIQDQLFLEGEVASEAAQVRVRQFMDHVRRFSGKQMFCRIESTSNFPRGSGIASSAAAFAAMALAAAKVYGLPTDPCELSRLARLGSGSACRSIYGGFVEWIAGIDHQSSYAIPLAPKDYWDLVDCVAVVSTEHKAVSSREGHRLAKTSPLQPCRVQTASQRIERCRRAILERDFGQLAQVVELDSNLMHSVMMTSQPPLFYWRGETLIIMEEVRRWRDQGQPVCYTVDAGPNVHVLTLAAHAEWVREKLSQIAGVKGVIVAAPGEGAVLV
ncbi:MAG: diphosphomevalonate decarboxylase [Anaerolineales bacterium]|nr:diphosphomevalonate decarboxylase [Anaerolineales bacterium]MDW8447037.1 diphosphomevalonate decarboxylase [Anaerolineales bacterium]